jgi:hypothetical protein
MASLDHTLIQGVGNKQIKTKTSTFSVLLGGWFGLLTDKTKGKKKGWWSTSFCHGYWQTDKTRWAS